MTRVKEELVDEIGEAVWVTLERLKLPHSASGDLIRAVLAVLEGEWGAPALGDDPPAE